MDGMKQEIESLLNSVDNKQYELIVLQVIYI